VSALKFFALNAAGGALWALVIGVLGYLVGQTLEVLLGELKRFEMAVLLAMALAGAAFWFVRWFRKPPETGR
jgi:membrane protein DedA with SNARE-associated domain